MNGRSVFAGLADGEVVLLGSVDICYIWQLGALPSFRRKPESRNVAAQYRFPLSETLDSGCRRNDGAI